MPLECNRRETVLCVDFLCNLQNSVFQLASKHFLLGFIESLGSKVKFPESRTGYRDST